MRALAVQLRAQGIAGCWVTLERCQGIEDLERAEPLCIQALHQWSQDLPAAWRAPNPAAFAAEAVGGRLGAYIRAWAASLDVPLGLLLDEADVVTGPAVVSLLRQLRDGFMTRGVGKFPICVALIGMRDLRDYVTQAKDGRAVNPGSPFNIKAASVTLRNFNAHEVGELLGQHTAETGQPFLPEAVEEIARVTDGQPFLVNALADLCVTHLVPDRSQPLTRAHVDEARERLIRSRTTHLDSLAERLKEPRVATIVQAVLLGDEPVQVDTDDFQYVVDLGLVKRTSGGAETANPLYREVLARQLSLNVQANLPVPRWPWASADGRLDFAAGRGAMDLLVDYGPDRFALEIKRVRTRDSLDTIVARGVAQLGNYLGTVGLEHG
jgi:hypothetical protein